MIDRNVDFVTLSVRWPFARESRSWLGEMAELPARRSSRASLRRIYRFRHIIYRFRPIIVVYLRMSIRASAPMPSWMSARVLVVFCGAAAALFCANLFPEQSQEFLLSALASSLEGRFSEPLLSPHDQIDGVIALGGGIHRTRQAIQLARLFPSAKLVVTGASEQDYALARGAVGHRLMVEPRARNTYENALFTRQMVQPAPSERWLLVTSASHMPRAMGCFLGVGFSVEPWPIREQPLSDANTIGMLRHEFLGLLAYRLMGRSDTLFPAPRSRPSTSL